VLIVNASKADLPPTALMRSTISSTASISSEAKQRRHQSIKFIPSIKLNLTQFDIAGSDILSQAERHSVSKSHPRKNVQGILFPLFGSRNGDEALSEYPGQGQLAWSNALLISDGFKSINEFQVLIDRSISKQFF
jgi:hypothetical protein